MTQAISLSNILSKNGHEVLCTFIGKSQRRQIPDFFRKKINSPIIQIDSPNFITDKNNKSIKLFSTILYNAGFLKRYYKSLKLIHKKVKEFQPDMVINFYDFLGGFYFRLFKSDVRHVCIGHQFLAEMPEFPFAGGRFVEKKLFQMNNRTTSQKAALKLALSFRPYKTGSHKNTVVIPPLIREEVKTLKADKGDFILGYMVNDGYGDEVITWHEPIKKTIKIECFWDRKGVDNPFIPHENLTFHQIGSLFMEKMRTCKAYASTAGFESVCEAMYLDKPVLMVPVDGQYEQACNAIDAELAGAGIYSKTFDIRKLVDYIPKHKSVGSWFKDWVDSAEKRALHELLKLKN